jgi:multiple sugar transport system substrate-binding protein
MLKFTLSLKVIVFIYNGPRPMKSLCTSSIVSVIIVVMVMSSATLGSFTIVGIPANAQKERVTITAMLEDQGDPRRWNSLFQPALQELRTRHPDKEISLNTTMLPYNIARPHMLAALGARTPVDLISLDQIWLGEFAQKGLLTDLTNYTKIWGRQSDWYQDNWDGGIYGGKVYGIWAWTDIRGIWYWKDLLNEAGVDPNSLKTWDGYIAAAKKLNTVLRPQGIEGIHLTGASHSPDLWYPYLWMLGGQILKMKSGHPTKGTYWFPAYNSTEGVRAMNFIKQQVDAGIKPQKNHFWGLEFLDRKFAVMIEGSWLPVAFLQNMSEKDFEDKIGFIPTLPVPYKNNRTSTLMGGWALSIPKTSTHKELAWKLIELVLAPKPFHSFLHQGGYLPTQISMGENDLLNLNTSGYPYYRQLVSMIQFGGIRPTIPEYPLIADNIRQAIYQVQFENEDPKLALAQAASKSAKVLGW